jgi:hypothetical protein
LREILLRATTSPFEQETLAKQRGHPYTYGEVLLAIARTGTAMNQTKIGKRIVLFGRPARANEKIGCLQPTNQRPTTHRIVVIRNGELVGGRSGR